MIIIVIMYKVNSVYKWKHIKITEKMFKMGKITKEEKNNYYVEINKVFKGKNKITMIEKNNFICKNKVTVLMPVYNLGSNKNLCIKSIKSVINQSYKNWELVIIDDHSTDGTYEYIVHYLNKLKNNKIKLIRNIKNNGCYVSLNEGIVNSTGVYLVRLDADDTFNKDKLNIQVNHLNNNKNIMAVFCSYKRNDGLIIEFAEVTALYRRSIIDKMGYYDSVRFAADSEFKARMIKVFGNKNIMNINKILYYVFKRNNSLTTSKKTGRSNIGNISRKDYKRKYKKWHNANKFVYIKYPLITRPFPVNNNMLI